MGIVGERRVCRMAVVACAGALLVALTGCAPTPAPASTTATPTPTTAPVFASDEEALAAATEAYESYIRTADQIIREGGTDPSRIRAYVSDELANSEIESFVTLEKQNLHGVGESNYSNFSVQQVSENHWSGENLVTAYVCSDLSKTDVVDEMGTSAVSPDRQDRTPFQVTFDLVDSESKKLLVSSVTVWDGGGVCL